MDKIKHNSNESLRKTNVPMPIKTSKIKKKIFNLQQRLKQHNISLN